MRERDRDRERETERIGEEAFFMKQRDCFDGGYGQVVIYFPFFFFRFHH